MGQEKTRPNFAVSEPLTQVFLLGVLAQRLGEALQFDRETKQITNHPVANQLLAGPPPRQSPKATNPACIAPTVFYLIGLPIRLSQSSWLVWASVAQW